MKRFLTAGIVLVLVLMFVSCADKPAGGQVSAGTSVSPSAAASEAAKVNIGFSLAKRGAFTDKLIADIEKECAAKNYTVQVSSEESPEKQQEDIGKMLSAEVSVLVIDPVDVDGLDTELAECDTYNIPVINAVDPVNGFVSMLISPDYTKAGKKAGECALEALPSGGGCMLLNTEFDSFTMQLMTDGFNTKIKGNSNMSVISQQFCETDEEKAYSTVKSELSKDIKFIFAQDPALGRGAMRAVQESGKDIKIVVFGGDMDIVGAVSSGKAYACIFCGPGAFAREAVSQAGNFIASASYVAPQYTEIPVTVVKQADASAYYAEGEVYAEAK